MCTLPGSERHGRYVFPSPDIQSMVSPTRVLLLMASLSINPDALPNICPYPRDRTNKRTGYDGCAGQLISHFPVISDLKLWAFVG